MSAILLAIQVLQALTAALPMTEELFALVQSTIATLNVMHAQNRGPTPTESAAIMLQIDTLRSSLNRPEADVAPMTVRGEWPAASTEPALRAAEQTAQGAAYVTPYDEGTQPYVTPHDEGTQPYSFADETNPNMVPDKVNPAVVKPARVSKTTPNTVLSHPGETLFD